MSYIPCTKQYAIYTELIHIYIYIHYTIYTLVGDLGYSRRCGHAQPRPITHQKARGRGVYVDMYSSLYNKKSYFEGYTHTYIYIYTLHTIHTIHTNHMYIQWLSGIGGGGR